MNTLHIKGTKQALLMIHGFTGSNKQLEEYGHTLAQHFSWTIDIPMLPGHGTSPEDLANTRSEMWETCVEERFQNLLKSHTTVNILALSMGCLLTLGLFKKHPQYIRSLVLLAPALSLHGFLQNFMFTCIGYLPKIPVNYMIPKSKPLESGNTYLTYPFAGVQELAKLAKRTRAILPLSAPPYLLAYSQKDTTIHGPSAKQLPKLLINPNAVVIELKESHHILPLAKERAYLLSRIIDFYESLEG